MRKASATAPFLNPEKERGAFHVCMVTSKFPISGRTHNILRLCCVTRPRDARPAKTIALWKPLIKYSNLTTVDRYCQLAKFAEGGARYCAHIAWAWCS